MNYFFTPFQKYNVKYIISLLLLAVFFMFRLFTKNINVFEGIGPGPPVFTPDNSLFVDYNTLINTPTEITAENSMNLDKTASFSGDCTTLSNQNCNFMSTCVLSKTNNITQCVAGTRAGPSTGLYDSFYYKNKCTAATGKSCPEWINE